jgi:hypothetical protein
MILHFLTGAACPPERIEERAIERSKFKRRKTSGDANLRRSAFMKEQIRCVVFFGSRA